MKISDFVDAGKTNPIKPNFKPIASFVNRPICVKLPAKSYCNAKSFSITFFSWFKNTGFWVTVSSGFGGIGSGPPKEGLPSADLRETMAVVFAIAVIYAGSRTIAAPIPPPMHNVAKPF